MSEKRSDKIRQTESMQNCRKKMPATVPITSMAGLTVGLVAGSALLAYQHSKSRGMLFRQVDRPAFIDKYARDDKDRPKLARPDEYFDRFFLDMGQYPGQFVPPTLPETKPEAEKPSRWQADVAERWRNFFEKPLQQQPQQHYLYVSDQILKSSDLGYEVGLAYERVVAVDDYRRKRVLAELKESVTLDRDLADRHPRLARACLLGVRETLEQWFDDYMVWCVEEEGGGGAGFGGQGGFKLDHGRVDHDIERAERMPTFRFDRQDDFHREKCRREHELLERLEREWREARGDYVWEAELGEGDCDHDDVLSRDAMPFVVGLKWKWRTERP